VRTITADGYKLMLNGQRVFLAGYGDDAVYPLTISPPRDKQSYADRLKFAHEHGFNFVRHHSHVLPPEYFQAADEWGLMISPELPCVYGGYFAAANATAQDLYLASWASYIASYRNHPSIFDWALCNEMYMGASFKKEGVVFGAEREVLPDQTNTGPEPAHDRPRRRMLPADGSRHTLLLLQRV
jgi:beta-galactosidase/beta-glucuronidase